MENKKIEAMSLRQYAKHRGVHPHSVEQAITTGRLSKSAIKNGSRWAIDAALADKEWADNTDPGQKRRATRGEMAQVDDPVKATAADPERIYEAINSAQGLEALLPDYVGQALAPVRVIVDALSLVPVEYRGYALAELTELLMSEFSARCLEIDNGN